MIQQAEALGFKYSRKGCPCSGTPVIYATKRSGTLYTLTIWAKRNAWRLVANGCVVAHGSSENLTTKIQAVWAL